MLTTIKKKPELFFWTHSFKRNFKNITALILGFSNNGVWFCGGLVIMKLINRIAGRRSYRKFYTVDKSLSFHINSGDGKHRKGHEGLRLSKGILQSHSYRGGAGPRTAMGASRDCQWVRWKQEEMLTLIRFSLSYWKKIKRENKMLTKAVKQHEHKRNGKWARRSRGNAERWHQICHCAASESPCSWRATREAWLIIAVSLSLLSSLGPFLHRGTLPLFFAECTLLFGLH